MKNIKIIDLQSEELQDLSYEELLEEIENHKSIKLQVPKSGIGSDRLYIDIISDCLDASYTIEKIASTFKNVTIDEARAPNSSPVFLLTIENYEAKKLAEVILTTRWAFQYPQDDINENSFHNIRSEIRQYEETITDINLFYPEIIDEYLANLVNGAYYELDYEVIAGQLAYFPERKFGYWAAAAYNSDVQKILLSVDAWIVPITFNLEHTFKKLGYGDEISLLKSVITTENNKLIAVSDHIAVSIPTGKIVQALACLEEVIAPKNVFQHKFKWTENNCSFSNPRSLDCPYTFEVFISEFSDFINVKTKSANIVIFNPTIIQNIKKCEPRKLFKEPSDIELEWSNISPEKFEQLCYDIIYHNPKFDKTTIRKYGKTNSRDGGRDIQAYTNPKPGEKPLKYIFQCKLKNPNNSLGTASLGAVTDVLEQYGADGYGVMCNCYIDPTLYDRLDAIEARRNIKVETWSILEIERFIAKRPSIKNRYFI
ncbi:hypothetical protein CCX46_22660 [Pseudomonas sp. RU47]|uniref:restriction endonuclease n=1 Tax=Pseudomonas sp. RU47 TaxID=2005388 RepID=UPI000FDEAB66|nr:restriction endonuclease [Pseudomonas sp. RU47]AZZ77818.1 hypothetical protein CCX46_22660 [Pseudomonas sp. RU47]